MKLDVSFQTDFIWGFNMRLRVHISTLFLVTMLSGCFPYAKTFTKIYGPGVTNSSYGCASDYDVPKIAEIRADGIWYFVKIDPDYYESSRLTIRADGDLGLVFPEPSIKVFSTSGEQVAEIPLNKPSTREFPFTKRKFRDSKYIDYSFRFPEHPKLEGDGAIQLPDMTVMGELRKGITLNFKQSAKIGIMPLNC